MQNTLKVGLIQLAPVWLDRIKTTEKIIGYLQQAGEQGCQLVALGAEFRKADRQRLFDAG